MRGRSGGEIIGAPDTLNGGVTHEKDPSRGWLCLSASDAAAAAGIPLVYVNREPVNVDSLPHEQYRSGSLAAVGSGPCRGP